MNAFDPSKVTKDKEGRLTLRKQGIKKPVYKKTSPKNREYEADIEKYLKPIQYKNTQINTYNDILKHLHLDSREEGNDSKEYFDSQFLNLIEQVKPAV